MFGSPPAIAYFHSPHLRKPGAKPAGADETGNGGEMKGTIPHLYTPAMMPSPVFLWRFKVALFLVWGFICCKIGWGSVMRMNADVRDLFLYEAFLYYNPLLLVPISFPDFFLADILTSMAKVFSDLERSVCRMVHHQVATIAWLEADSVCGSHSAAIPLVLVIPYTWRLMQCLRQYMDTKEKTTLLNALKYSTAVPVIFLSALKYHVLPDTWTCVYRRLWLFSSVVNSLYSFYWDVTHDWDLSVFARIFKFNKPSYYSSLLYGRRWVYFWVIGSDLILRCTWTYKLSAHLRHNYLTVFMITTLEMLRRFQWIFFRIENEWNKITKSGVQLNPVTDIQREDEKLLGSTNHYV
ncbi:hypothetical protein V6N11_012366 [Hibiscus sabdariffa]|uniref:EXS domain-containing protein n=1 Tax=Hibiscus sabdariffa TaxID=183260 RepID=A0ABR2QB25_9ROSI